MTLHAVQCLAKDFYGLYVIYVILWDLCILHVPGNTNYPGLNNYCPKQTSDVT